MRNPLPYGRCEKCEKPATGYYDYTSEGPCGAYCDDHAAEFHDDVAGVSNSVKAEAVETVAAPTPALIESERLDLLRRVAEVWEGAGYRVLRQKDGCEAIWLRREPGRVAYALTLTWDTADAGAIILLLDEMEKRGERPYLWYSDSVVGGTPFYRCDLATTEGPWQFRGATRAEAVARAFVAVMEAVKG